MTFKERFGDWALITGASSGIGKAFAHALAAEGVNLALSARRVEELEGLKAEIQKKTKVEVRCVRADLAAEGFLEDIQRGTKGLPISILVNNAGFGTSGHFEAIDAKKEIDMVKVNCLAPVILTRAYLPAMLERRKGALVFLSSIGANQPSPLCTTYAATKAFDLFLGEGLWGELKGSGVAVLSVKPGQTATEFMKVADYKDEPGMRRPEDVARTAMRALGRKRTVTDGFPNKILSGLAAILPRGLSIAYAKAFNDSHRKK
jgi:uncharacterized protein